MQWLGVSIGRFSLYLGIFCSFVANFESETSTLCTVLGAPVPSSTEILVNLETMILDKS